MPSPLRSGPGWWTVEHAGAPRWLIAVAVAVFLACIASVALNGTAGARLGGGSNAVGSSPSSSPLAASPTASPSPDDTGSAGAGVQPAASASPSEIVTPSPSASPPPTVAFIGDAYTAGVGASTPAARWTTLLSSRLGWTELNFGAAGTGYVTSVSDNAAAVCGLDRCPSYEEVVPQVAAARPDVVVVSGGRNDIDPAALRQDRVANALRTTRAVDRTLEAIRTALPDADLVVLSPIWDDDSQDTPTVRAHRESVRSAAAAVGAIYIDLGEPLRGRSDLVGADGIHPNDAGYLAIADAVGTPDLG